MAQLSRTTSQYRDGVFSAATPAPRYGTLSTAFENGSLGDDDSTLETDAAALIDPALDRVVASLQPAGLETRALPPAAFAAARVATVLAQQARAEPDIEQKIVLAIAASYSATFFGLPRNTLLYTIDQVFGMFAMSASQRRAYHQMAARALDGYVKSLKKGNAMSGVFRDGVLGNAYKDGSLGRQQGATRDGSLGALMLQNGAFHDGSLGAMRRPRVWNMRRAPQLRGLGCGCSGVGADALPVVATVTPFYKKPLVIGGAAIALGVVLYAVTR